MRRQFLLVRGVVQLRETCQRKISASAGRTAAFAALAAPPPGSALEVLTSRLIDRPIRPLFPDGFRCETQVIATVLSHDRENDPDVIALTGASAALHVSDIPFEGPIAAVRLGRVDGAFVVNPTQQQIEQSDLQIVVAGTRDGLVMVEGGARSLPEADSPH